MKQLKKSILSFTLLIVSALFGLSSCGTDTEMAVTLCGEWEGYFGSYYTSNRGYTYSSTYSTFKFEPDGYYKTHGTGVEVDYYDEGPYEYFYYYFEWSIKHKKIYLTYPYNPDMDVVISDYDLYDDTFSGYCADVSFRLRKISDYYDWSPYTSQYGGYHSRDDSSESEASATRLEGEELTDEEAAILSAWPDDVTDMGHGLPPVE